MLSDLFVIRCAVLELPQDAIVVGMARDEPSERAGSLQSLCWGSRVGTCLTVSANPAICATMRFSMHLPFPAGWFAAARAC
jgi:hypothetical protein